MKPESSEDMQRRLKTRLAMTLDDWIEKQGFAQLSEKENKLLTELFGLGVTTGMALLSERYEGKL